MNSRPKRGDVIRSAVRPTSLAALALSLSLITNALDARPTEGATPSGPQTHLGPAAWVPIAPASPLPAGRHVHTATHDPVRNQMLLFGGLNGTTILGDLWTLELGTGPAWAQIATSATSPTSRRGHTIIHDPLRDRFIFFGGYDGAYRNDTWVLTLDPTPTWTQLTPGGTIPPGLYWHSAILDPVRDRMIVFAGQRPGVIYETNDVYALSLSGGPVWTKLAPTGSLPTARAGHLALYDPERDRMVVFGGRRYGGFLNDVWTMSLGANPAWSQLSPSGPLPGVREGSPGIYDPNGDRLLAFGGWDGSVVRNDLWALPLSGPLAWEPISTVMIPAARSGASAVYDSGLDRMILFGGNNTQALNDTWAFLRGARIAREDGKVARGVTLSPGSPEHEFRLEGIGPNPFSSTLTLRMSSSTASTARLRILDVTGRVIRRWDGLDLEPGSTRIEWDGTAGDGRAVSSGVYFLRVEAGAYSLSRKIVRLAR